MAHYYPDYYYDPDKDKKVVNVTPPQETRLEKLFSAPPGSFHIVDHTTYVNEDINALNTLRKGRTYMLKGMSCDGFKTREKVYEVVGFVDRYHGVDINSVIVKQVSGDHGLIFTLSKNDCNCLNIEYEPGLQLFPLNMPWELVVEKVPFVEDNMGTIPLSLVDGTVRYMLLRITGFNDFEDGLIQTPSKHLITEKQFLKSLRVIAKLPLVYNNAQMVEDGKKLNISVLKLDDHMYPHGNFISSDGEIHVLIDFRKKRDALIMANHLDTEIGIERMYLADKNLFDMVEVKWDEFGAQTVDEYNKAKERARKAEEERIRKAEEERIRKIQRQEAERAERERMRKERVTVCKEIFYDVDEIISEMPKFEPLNFTGDVRTIERIDKLLDSNMRMLNDHIERVNKSVSDIIGKVKFIPY